MEKELKIVHSQRKISLKLIKDDRDDMYIVQEQIVLERSATSNLEPQPRMRKIRRRRKRRRRRKNFVGGNRR